MLQTYYRKSCTEEIKCPWKSIATSIYKMNEKCNGLIKIIVMCCFITLLYITDTEREACCVVTC